jgi:STE24 endopeptidase
LPDDLSSTQPATESPGPSIEQPQPTTVTPDDSAARYHRTGRVLAVAGYLIDVTVLVVLLLSGWSIILRSFAERIARPWALALLIYAGLLGLILKAASLPLDYLDGFWLEHRYGLSRLTLTEWLKDELKGLLVGALLGGLALELIYGVLRAWPRHWWIVAAGVFAGFFILMANLAPVLLLPIFFKLKPLSNAALEERLRRLAESAGARVKGVYEWKLGEKTRKANAALTGLGNTRRILLADTLLENFSDDEIEAVLAHELGHHVHADIWRGLAVQTAATFLGLYGIHLALDRWSVPLGFRGPADFANVPLLALVTLGVSLLLLPAVNAFSRHAERAADLFALRSVAQPAVFASALERLGRLNMAERQPHPWIEFVFYSHPSIGRRIEFIQRNAAHGDSQSQAARIA